MMRNSTARQLLYAWHGGMSSAFYAAASSGLVAKWDDLYAEITTCYHSTTTTSDHKQLGRLLEWLTHQRGASTLWVNHPADGRTYSALPWSKRTCSSTSK